MKRGFTLLEVAISIALMVVVLGVTMGIIVKVLAENRRQRVHAEILRDAMLTTQLLNSDLRQAGLGAPRNVNESTCLVEGLYIRKNCTPDPFCSFPCVPAPCVLLYGSGTRPASFDTSVILANATQVGIVGDLARPDSQYSAYGPLHNRATAGASTTTTSVHLMWHNENNGLCAPGNGPPACNLGNTSTFFAGESTDLCTVANPNARTCPWGMNRVRAGERLQIVAGDRSWSTAALADPLNVVNYSGGRLAVVLSPGFDVPMSDGDAVNDAVWPNTVAGDGPGGIAGQGWVTTLDRVFFIHDPTLRVIQRVQCSGDPDPQHASWPNAGVNALALPVNIASLQLTASVTAPVTTAPHACVGPEVVARNVDNVTFTYVNAANTALVTGTGITGIGATTCGPFTPPTTGKNAIRRIDYVINFRKSVDASPAHDVTHAVSGSVRLQNL